MKDSQAGFLMDVISYAFIFALCLPKTSDAQQIISPLKLPSALSRVHSEDPFLEIDTKAGPLIEHSHKKGRIIQDQIHISGLPHKHELTGAMTDSLSGMDRGAELPLINTFENGFTGPMLDIVHGDHGRLTGVFRSGKDSLRAASGEDCPDGICPSTFTVIEPFQFESNLGGCFFTVTVQSGTIVILEELLHFYFPFNGDNYCGCQYVGEAELPEPCINGMDTITSIIFRVRAVDMHFHLRDDVFCEYHDDVDMQPGGPHVDPNASDEMYFGHPDLIAKMQTFWYNVFGWDQILGKCQPLFELVRDRTSQRGCFPVESRIIDGNLAIDTQGMHEQQDIRLLHPDELLQLSSFRNGVASDGVSSVVVQLQFEEKGRIDHLTIEGGFEMPWGDTTYFSDGKYYVFLLFVAPETFDPKGAVYPFQNEVDAWDLKYEFDFVGLQETQTLQQSIPLVRPPVVLLHSTYSNPVEAWKTSAEGYISFFDRLSEEGFKVFTTNYVKSNGTIGAEGDISSFVENTNVIWGEVYPSNEDGIKDALAYYREIMGVAVTQADVIGHGLGGVLARVYASDHFNPEYKRVENFMEGDINRLITIGSSHGGSNLCELQIFLENLTLFDIGSLQDWIVSGAAGFIADWAGGTSPSKAVVDQRPAPDGQALELIGRTEIPSHAITCKVPKGSLLDPVFDPDEKFYDLYWFITTLMYQADNILDAYLERKLQLIEMGLQASTTLDGGDPGVLYKGLNNLTLYKTMIQDGIHNAGKLISILDGSYEFPSEIDIFRYAFAESGMGDLADPLLDIFVFGADPAGVALEYFIPFLEFPTPQEIIINQLRVNESSMEGFRALIFNNDENDGVVRVQSQTGSIETECTSCVTHLDTILHGFAPRYPKVQARVIELLEGGMDFFNPIGFPPSDTALKIYFPPERIDLFKVPKRDAAAICQSGMQPAHARAFAHIADENNVIIITRPVNPDGTDLITRNAATKGMDIKPKSSNWGPQKGFLPVNQRYSKLSKIFKGDERKNKIIEYTDKAMQDIIDSLAQARPLQVEACNGIFRVFIDSLKFVGDLDTLEEDEILLVPLIDSTKVCLWGKEFSQENYILDCQPRGPQHHLIPLEVLASNSEFEPGTNEGRYLTADYDLLMVGFYKGSDIGDPMPPELSFEMGVGQITPEQLQLLDKLNTAVAATGYKGGKVVHHGPENQFNKSPYIDYPLTVFAPDEIPNGFLQTHSDGIILSIEMGPPGFRDINLKQFVNKMRHEGYDLYHNPEGPGWLWEWDAMAELYKLEDSPMLPGYIEQLPLNHCDKHGGQVHLPCPGLIKPIPTEDVKPFSWLFGWRSSVQTTIGTLIPNPVYGATVSFSMMIPGESTFTWFVIDAMGIVRNRHRCEDMNGQVDIEVDVQELEPGVYSILTDVFGPIGRFVKM